MNMGMQRSLQDSSFNSFGYLLSNGSAGFYGVSFCTNIIPLPCSWYSTMDYTSVLAIPFNGRLGCFLGVCNPKQRCNKHRCAYFLGLIVHSGIPAKNSWFLIEFLTYLRGLGSLWLFFPLWNRKTTLRLSVLLSDLNWLTSRWGRCFLYWAGWFLEASWEGAPAVCVVPRAVWFGTLLKSLRFCTSKWVTVSGYRLVGGF